MTLTKRIALLLVLLALFAASSFALPVQSGSCSDSCIQGLFDSLDECNTVYYIDQGVYEECARLAQQRYAACQGLCRVVWILGKAQPKSAAGIHSFVRLTE
jgi:hypothetical protein